jgi:hypothetical protein
MYGWSMPAQRYRLVRRRYRQLALAAADGRLNVPAGVCRAGRQAGRVFQRQRALSAQTLPEDCLRALCEGNFVMVAAFGRTQRWKTAEELAFACNVQQPQQIAIMKEVADLYRRLVSRAKISKSRLHVAARCDESPATAGDDAG